MYRVLFAFLVSLPYLPLAGADNGMITARCPDTVDATLGRLQQVLSGKGMPPGIDACAISEVVRTSIKRGGVSVFSH